MGSLFLFRRDDSGMALFIAMAAIALMFLLTTTAFYFASQTLFEAKLADQHDVAFQAASSGVMVAFADLQAKLASLRKDVPYTYAGTIATSTASYAATATYNPASSVASESYDCTSTGTSADGTKEEVVASFRIIPAAPALLPYGSEVYAGGMITNTSGSGVLSGGLYILFPTMPPPNTQWPTVRLRGNMQLSGGPVYIQYGNLTIKKVANPLTVYTNGGNVTQMAGVTVVQSAPTVTLNSIDATTFLSQSLANAIIQSTDGKLGDTGLGLNGGATELAQYTGTPCPGASRGSYKVVQGALSLPPSTDFGYVSGTSHDDFAYRTSTKTLYLEGTVYVSGDVSIGDITYVGRGTIVCTGKMTISGNVTPYPANAPPDASHLLCGFTPLDLTFSGNNEQCVGAFYAKGSVLVSNKTTLTGSIISESGLGTAKNNANSLTFTPVTGIADWVKAMPNQVTTSSGTPGSPSLKMTFWKRL